MNLPLFLKVLFIHLFAVRIVYASAGSWAYQQIETDKAWELARSRGEKITVAIVDTGLDLKSPAKLWTNPGETGLDQQGRDKSSNGLDDDQNGFIDDVHGWNFVSNSPHFSDRHGHGTHIAGIISSVAPDASLMILKYYDPKLSPEQNVQNTLKAFRYALQMKAHIINFSGGGPGANLKEEEILVKAEKANVLLVAAAGNDGMNTDLIRYYPANYPLSNILSVTALDATRKIPEYGNFGRHTVHLAAPGDQIPSQLLFGRQGEMSGTSQATAFATGVAALVMSQSDQKPKPAQLIEKLIQSGSQLETLREKVQASSALNAYRALAMKSSFESAAGFVFQNEADWDSNLFTMPSTLPVKKRLGL
ncbi:MAG: S8 family peptidase [Pseudobdellovibrionaceae bacterium]